MITHRSSAVKKPSPITYFKRFEDNLNILKENVENFNTRENDGTLANIPQNNSKKLLKKMTEPRYQKVVAKMLSNREKSCQVLNGKESTLSRSPLQSRISSIKRKNQHNKFVPQIIFPHFLSESMVSAQESKEDKLKLKIQKKQQLLEKQWEKVENFRSLHHIYYSRPPYRPNKKQGMIIRRVQMRRPNTSVDPTMYPTERTDVIYTEPA